MNLSSIFANLQNLEEYQHLRQELEQNASPCGALGLPRSIRPPIAVALAEDLMRPVVYVVSRSDHLLTLMEEIPAWSPDLQVLPFPVPGPLFYEQTPWGPRTIRQRIAALAALTKDRQPGGDPLDDDKVPTLIIAPVRSIMTRTISPRQFISHSRWLKIGNRIRMDQLLKLLVSGGYAHTSLVTEPGQFSRRGGILDIWAPAETNPIRFEFFGDEIDSIRSFNPASQRSIETLKQIRVTPAREGLPGLFQDSWKELIPPPEEEDADALLEFFLPWMNPTPSGLLDFLPEGSIILLDDRFSLEDAISDFEQRAIDLRNEQLSSITLPYDMPLPYLTLTEVDEIIEHHPAIDLGHMAGEEECPIRLSDRFTPGPRFGGQLKPLMNYIAEKVMMHDTVVVVSRQGTRLSDLYSQEQSLYPVIETLPSDLSPGGLYFIQGALSEGWTLKSKETWDLHLLSDAEIFGWARPKPRRRPIVHARAPESQYADLTKGDVVVHVDYGIGRFQGLVERTLDNLQREYLMVEYAGGDQVYVPIHQADRITRYVGADGSIPDVSRLGTQEWERAKSKAKKAVEDVAKDLLELYAKRNSIVGHAFSPDTPWQRELEASFPYIETDDQLRSIEAVKQSMELPRPMDILVCGDAGYGKTEVALRAAFKAVMDGKQVAMLVPTTVLAQQHFRTFKQRLAAFPVEVEMLSRFRNRKEATEIIKKIKANQIDIVIGTHRLLQQDVHFKDLGLLIIDEEQRFGVTHKEFLKQKRTEVDVLTMTATPIPRTLYMALTGARDIYTINTPPDERLPVITHVGPYDPKIVRQAILRELDRGGQTYFVHNRVMTIDAMRLRLERLIPEARISVAHGQMPEQELSSVMDEFTKSEVDVLVCSSIIESGLDIPNANTLIVDRADRFGLAQLYQLRGRVGRSASRAYSYFFRHPTVKITDEAYQRLDIFAEHTQLGAGFSLAMRDLELRGSGDILGTRQHGHISAIGFHLYTRLLTDAIRRKRMEFVDQPQLQDRFPQTAMPLSVAIDLPLATAIPEDYVYDRQLRLQLYRRMSEFRSKAEIQSLAEELIDRFGELPEEVENLLYQLELRIIADQAGIISVSSENGQVLIQLPDGWPREVLPDLGSDVRTSKRGLWLRRSKGMNWKSMLVDVVEALAKAYTATLT